MYTEDVIVLFFLAVIYFVCSNLLSTNFSVLVWLPKFVIKLNDLKKSDYLLGKLIYKKVGNLQV